MAMKSSWITAPTANTVKANGFKVYSTVSTDSVVVDAKAKTHYNNIIKAYNDVAKDFDSIAAGLKGLKDNFAKKDTKTRNALQKASTACSNQAGYCRTRKNQLVDLFEYATLESKVAELENMIIKMSEGNQ